MNVILLNVKERLKKQLLNKGITINARLLPVIYASELHITKLFHNVINNCIRIKITDQPLIITITGCIVNGQNINHPAANKHKNYYFLRFSDTGCGLESADMESVFSLYNYVLDTQGKIGIELPLSRKICEMHSGFILAHSIDGMYNIDCYLPVE